MENYYELNKFRDIQGVTRICSYHLRNLEQSS